MSSEKYIRILSHSSSSMGAQDRYIKWHSALQRLDVPWGMKGVDRKAAKISMSGRLGVTYRMNKGVKTFGVEFYQGRSNMDDAMGVTFNADKFAGILKYIWDVVVPKYIEAMRPYKISVEDVDFLVKKGALIREMPYEERMAYREGVRSDREQLKGIWQVNYWADQQCLNYFGMPAEVVVSKLHDNVAKAMLIDGGAYIIYSYDVMSAVEVAAIEPAIRKILG